MLRTSKNQISKNKNKHNLLFDPTNTTKRWGYSQVLRMVNSSYSSGSIRRVTLATILVITIFYQEYQYGADEKYYNI
jgi:hypothetical protein